MPTIRYMRNEEGAEKMLQDGYCWADAYLWQMLDEDYIERGLKKHPHLKTRNFVHWFEDVGKQHKCGYCGACMTQEEMNKYHGLEETVNDR